MFGCVGVQRVIVTHNERSGACNLHDILHISNNIFESFTMPPFLHLVAQLIAYVIRIVATHGYVWVRPILIEAGRELLERADGILAAWTAR